MGCAVSNTRTLCKGIGVENDKPRNVMGLMPKKMQTEEVRDTTGITMPDQRMAYEDTGGGVGGFTQRMASFENNLVQSGKNTFEDMTGKGREAIDHTMGNIKDLGKSLEENITSGAEELAEKGKTVVEDFSHEVEEEVTKVSENVKSKVEDVKSKVDSVFDVEDKTKDMAEETTKGVDEAKEDIGEKIDEILAISVDENS